MVRHTTSTACFRALNFIASILFGLPCFTTQHLVAQDGGRRDISVTATVHTNHYEVKNEGYQLTQSVDRGLVVTAGRRYDTYRIARSFGVISDNVATHSRAAFNTDSDSPGASWFLDNHSVGMLHYGIDVTFFRPAGLPAWIPDVSGGVSFLFTPGDRKRTHSTFYQVSDGIETKSVRVVARDYVERPLTPFLHLGGEYVFRKTKRIQIPLAFGYRIPVFRSYRRIEASYSENDGPYEPITVEKSGLARYVMVSLRFGAAKK